VNLYLVVHGEIKILIAKKHLVMEKVRSFEFKDSSIAIIYRKMLTSALVKE